MWSFIITRINYIKSKDGFCIDFIPNNTKIYCLFFDEIAFSFRTFGLVASYINETFYIEKYNEYYTYMKKIDLNLHK